MYLYVTYVCLPISVPPSRGFVRRECRSVGRRLLRGLDCWTRPRSSKHVRLPVSDKAMHKFAYNAFRWQSLVDGRHFRFFLTIASIFTHYIYEFIFIYINIIYGYIYTFKYIIALNMYYVHMYITFLPNICLYMHTNNGEKHAYIHLHLYTSIQKVLKYCISRVYL